MTGRAIGDLETSTEECSPVISRRVGLRYSGQGYDIPIDLPGGPVDLANLESAFHVEHERQYGFARRDQRVQLVNIWVSAEVSIAYDQRKPAERTVSDTPMPDSIRPVYLSGNWVDTPIYDRTMLRPGHRINGPAIIEQLDSTTLIRPNQNACIDAWNQITITGLGTP